MIYWNLHRKIEKVAALSKSTKWKRLINNPFKYLLAIGLKNFIYPFWHQSFLVRCKLFTGQNIRILLPASTDIFLTGGKSHITEIKLAKFLMQNLNEGSVFWDIGAHYGYFSMLGSQVVSDKGKVLSVEASPATFKYFVKTARFWEILRFSMLPLEKITG